jgi:hypothetical protein
MRSRGAKLKSNPNFLRFPFRRRPNFALDDGKFGQAMDGRVGERENEENLDWILIWWLGTELNRRHTDFQSAALPTELPSRFF